MYTSSGYNLHNLNVNNLLYLLHYFEIDVFSVLNYVCKLIKTNMLITD